MKSKKALVDTITWHLSKIVGDQISEGEVANLIAELEEKFLDYDVAPDDEQDYPAADCGASIFGTKEGR